MKKSFFSLLFLPLMVANSANVETVIETEVSGENASVHTEITNIVNDKETKVESDQPGEIRVEVKNGEVKVESSPEVQPTVVITDLTQEETEEKTEEAVSQVKEIQIRISSFLENLISRLRNTLFFWR
jgi:hypothetical protein